MPHVDFATLPDTASAWVFAASRELQPAERDELLTGVDRFLDGWAAHGVPLTCARDWRYDRFLVVGVDETAAGVSGCSIDALTHLLQEVERRFSVTMLDHGPVLYRSDDAICRESRDAFGARVDAGHVDLDTIVFDNTITTVAALRAGEWETAARSTWHGRAFFGLAPPPLSSPPPPTPGS